MKEIIWDLLYGCAHSVGGVYSADYCGPALVARVVLDADALDVGNNYEILPDLLGKSADIELLAENSVCLAERVETVTGDRTETSYSESGAGEGLTVYHCMRKTERLADYANLVLVKQFYGLDKLKLKVLGKSSDVVVRFYCLLAFCLLYAFKYIGVDSTLRKILDALKLSCFLCEYFYADLTNSTKLS